MAVPPTAGNGETGSALAWPLGLPGPHALIRGGVRCCRRPRVVGRHVFVDRPRKHDRDCNPAHRREARGFWERERGGKMVFRPGTWEQESDRERKRAKTQNGGSVEKNAKADRAGEAKKEKPLAEEQARHYQLEVLEQAKSRNTIAFLETGAGKTLIAVLLIKSICDKMMEENRKILAVFLVPKVPLVYQVVHTLHTRLSFQ